MLGAPVDVPLLFNLPLRTIHKIGLCYGFEGKSREDREFVLGIFAASGANPIEETYAALTSLRLIQVSIAKQTWKVLEARAMQSRVDKEFAIIGTKHLTKQLGINVIKRKALAVIPGVGAFVGGSVNGWYLKDVGWAARYCFQERRLIHNSKFTGPKKPPTPPTGHGPKELS